jgi:hypothetical protein
MAQTPTSAALALPSSTSLFLQVRSVDDLTRLARVFAASGLFGRGNPEEQIAKCAVQLLAGMEAGMTPFASVTSVYVVNGRPGFSAQSMAQAIKRHPDYDYRVLEKTDKICRIEFRHRGEVLGVETFTIDMARRAGLTKDGGMYSKYPEALLFARCLTAGMRTHCPDALGGHTPYTPEELGAEGEINEDGMVTVTVTEEPTRDKLQAQAVRRLRDAGLTSEGTRAMLTELGGPDVTGLGQLSDRVLGRLAKSGASAETIARWNASTAEAGVLAVVSDHHGDDVDLADESGVGSDDEPPATWDQGLADPADVAAMTTAAPAA